MKSVEFVRSSRARSLSSLGAALITLLLFAGLLHAQSGTGAITGTVRDANGGVVPGAEVTATHSETNIARQTITTEGGVFHFGALPLGPYTLSVQITGFKKWTGKLELQVGQTAVVNASLEVGDIQTTVEVSAAAPAINTESIDVSDVKDYQRIRQLPLNGRNISSLFNLTPGVEGGANARVNGLKVGSLDITLDGATLVDRFGGGVSRVQPGLDTVAEFRIETVGSDARYARPATVTLATRSGTNEFHGSLFETHRNNAVGLARRRENTGEDPSKLIRNEFGASAGGPFYLGSLYDGRNKSFWFVAYEGLRQLQERFTTYTTTPTAAMWNGDLSNMVDSDGNRWVVYDPLTTNAAGVRQAFSGNIIPTSRISAFAKTVQALTALPTNGSNPHVSLSNFEKFYPDTLDNDKLTIKGDHQLTSKDALSVRWTRNTRNSAVEGGVFGAPINAEDGVGTQRSDTTVNNVSIGYNRTFTPSLLNELLVGFNRSFHDQGTLADFTDWPQKLGLPNPFGVTGWPTFYAYSGPTYFGFDADNHHNQALTGGSIENNTTWNKGNHTFQFGGRFRKEWNNVRELQQAQGSHDFGGNWTSLFDADDDAAAAFTGSGFADMLLGLPGFLSNQYNRGYFYFRQNETSLYATDRWKISPRLTVTLGLRWDKWTPYSEKYNRLVVADIQRLDRFEVVTPGDNRIETLPGIPPSVLASWSNRGLTYTTADAVGMPDALFAGDSNNFGPRLGAAFRLSNKMVLRGGYGEYFWTMPLSQILQSTRNNAPLNLRFTADIENKNGVINYPLKSRPDATDFIGRIDVPTDGIVTINPLSPSSATTWDARNWGDGRAQSWHLTFEQELPSQIALRLSYVGTHSSGLEQQFELNTREAEYNYVQRTGLAPPSQRDLLRRNKDWTFIALDRSGYSNAHSGQIEVERRFVSGFAFQWFYTYTRALTTSDAGGFTTGNVGINSTGGGGRVPESHQLWGSPNMSYDDRLKLAYFNSTTIPPHRIRYNAIGDLPFGKGKKFGADAPTAVDLLIGGWQVAAIGDWRGGNWFSVDPFLYQFGDPFLTESERVEMTIFGRQQRLWFKGYFEPSQATNVTGGNLESLVPADRSQRVLRPLGPNYNNQIPQVLANGTTRNTPIGELYNYSPRASLLGPGAWNLDLALYKNFKIKEEIGLRFSADFFNIFNHPNDVGPGDTGFNTRTGLQDLSRQNNDPRTIQFSLRLDW